MTKALLVMLLCWASAAINAADIQPSGPDEAERAAVAAVLSQRSGLPDAELSGLLADCNANQQSMYLCAWRDQIAAERTFERVRTAKLQEMPQCKTVIAPKLESWARSRDRTCEKSASKEWGGGSLRPTARAICVTVETVRMTQRLERMVGCKLR